MSRTLVSALLLAAVLVVPAHAEEAAPPPDVEPVGKLTPPPGWSADIGQSRGLELAVGREDHFGGVEVHVSAQHLRAPQPGGILLTTEIATATLPSDPGLAASAEMHGLRSGLESLGDTVKVVRWDIKPDAAAKVTEGLLEWSDASLGTTTISRTLMFQTGGHLVRLTAECIIAADAGGLRGPCEAALSSLAPLAPVTARDALQVSAVPPAPVLPDVAPPRPEGPIPRSTGPTISEREGEMPVTIVVDKPKQKADRRPYYVFGGLAVIVAIFLLNRRARQRLEAESKPEPKPEPEPEAKPSDEERR